MTDDGSGAITFDGLSTGLKSGDIVEQLVKVARLPIRQIERRTAIEQAHRDAYGSIVEALKSLSNTADTMSQQSGLAGVNASVSDGAYLSAAASSNAQLGSHVIKVQQLAAAQLTYSDSKADAETTGLFGSGTVEITMHDGSQRNFTVDGSTTLSSLQQQIVDSGLGVTASVIHEGSSARLSLQSAQSGLQNSFTVLETGTTLGLGALANTPQAAADSQFLLDNTSTITRSSNTINDVLEGVTLQLEQVDPGQQTLSLTGSPAASEEALKRFVEGYNKVVGMIYGVIKPDLSQTDSKEAKATQEAENKARMPGDSTLRMLLNKLQGVLAQVIPGADANANTLAGLGVKTNNEGFLQVDESAVQTALTADPSSIAKLFARTFGVNGGPGIANQMLLVTQSAQQTGGPLQTRMKSIDDAVRRMATDIEAKERSLEVYENNLKSQFSRLETLMAKLKSQGDYLSALGGSNRS